MLKVALVLHKISVALFFVLILTSFFIHQYGLQNSIEKFQNHDIIVYVLGKLFFQCSDLVRLLFVAVLLAFLSNFPVLCCLYCLDNYLNCKVVLGVEKEPNVLKL